MAIPFAGPIGRVSSFVGGLGPRTRKVLRYAGYTLLGLVTFVFAFQAVFPFQRVKERMIDALSDKYDVTIGSIERGIVPARMYVHAFTIRTRPSKPDEVASTLYIEQLEVDVGLLALLRGALAVKLDAKIGPGRLAGKIVYTPNKELEVDLDGTDLPSGSLPMREVIGLPMSGKVELGIDFDLPFEKAKTGGKIAPNFAKADGHVQLACPSGCTFGDGKTKLKPKLKNSRSQAMAEGGIDFGKVTVDSLLARLDVKNGKATVSKFDFKSADGDVKVDLDVALNQDLQSSTVAGCLRFVGSDALAKREPKTHSAITLTGAPRGPDNLFHIKLEGTIRDMRRLGLVCSGGEAGSNARPNLTPEAHTPIPSTPAAPPPPIPPPTQPVVTPPQPAVFPEDAGVGSGSAMTSPHVEDQPGGMPPAGMPAGSATGGVVPPGAPIPQGQVPVAPPGGAQPPSPNGALQ